MTTFSSRDIKNRKFKQSLMGVDSDEVKSFLKVVATEFDRILTLNDQLEKRLTEQAVKSSLGSRKEADKAAEKNRKAEEDAGKAAEEIIAQARAASEEIRKKSREGGR